MVLDIHHNLTFYSTVGWSLVLVTVGGLTLKKVIAVNPSTFGVFMVTTVIGYGLLSMGQEMCLSIFVPACGNKFVYGNYKADYCLVAFSSLVDSHMIVFALKYLDKGMEYSRVVTSQRTKNVILYSLFGVSISYFLAIFVAYLYACAT